MLSALQELTPVLLKTALCCGSYYPPFSGADARHVSARMRSRWFRNHFFFLSMTCQLWTMFTKWGTKDELLENIFFLMRLTGYWLFQFINRNMLNYIVFHSSQITVICINSSTPHMNYMQKEVFYRWDNWHVSSVQWLYNREAKSSHSNPRPTDFCWSFLSSKF